MDLYPAYVGRIPIRRINFTTAEKERKQLLEQGKRLYQEYLQNQGWDKVLTFVDECFVVVKGKCQGLMFSDSVSGRCDSTSLGG